MHLPQRRKWLKLSVFFFLYSIITAYAQNLKHSLDQQVKSTSSSMNNNTEIKLQERELCTPPAIEQFPHPLMSQWTRQHGGILVHILLVAYVFVALAIVCDNYFVASLNRICEDLNVTPDVAGATFMAAGSSAPELATVLIGVFCAKDDIGISGVIGSAVFNITFVISVSALASSTVCHLHWWPLVRDCFFYAVSILVMLYTIFDEYVTWDESLLMLVLYIVYCTVLYFNPQLEYWSQKLVSSTKREALNEKSSLVIQATIKRTEDNNIGESKSLEERRPIQLNNYNSKKIASIKSLEKPYLGFWEFTSYVLVYPIRFLNKFTIPDCRLERRKKWYPITFLTSMLWIALYSYIMVWMITIIGTTLGIPDTVMGLTFLAAGVSVPDALASVAVIKEGQGDMAVSNAVGSNVFDILICLGIPWFLQTGIIAPGSHINVTSKGLTYSTVTLFSTVIFLLVTTYWNGWKLDKKYGVILMIWYVIFTILASLYELNVFGKLNPPTCPTSY